ncbi:MAG: molecular chaperone HtpG [Acidobacteriota bacterium]
MAEKQTKDNKNKFEFQSEVKQLLNILVYSLYKHKEVFLRELISNAIDALNKVKFTQLTEPDIEDASTGLEINISIDKKNGRLIIEDTGIGMSKKDLINNIGTIAHSGAIDFLKKSSKLEKNEKVDLIGRFGVGFYSSFMVAKEIFVYTKSFKKGSKSLVWKSKGDNSFTIDKSEDKVRGTRIELVLKDEEKEFLEKSRIQTIIEKHSKFSQFPIKLENEEIKSADAIWTQPKTNLKKNDYIDFYKFFENTSEEPETYIHLSSDAPVQFNAILYFPKSNFEIYGIAKKDPGIDLYSNKVLIDKGSKDIVPEHFRFIVGIVDSMELPLNISRESIQSNIKIEKIKKYIVKKIVDELVKLKSKKYDQYLNLWKNFERNIKEGIINDFDNRTKLADTLLFKSSKTKKEEFTDLSKYKESMGESHKEIFYVSGSDISSIEKNPSLEIFRKNSIEVLYLIDPIDEFVLEHLKEYNGLKFKLIERSDIDLVKPDEEKKDKDSIDKLNNFIGYLKTIYGDRIEKIEISKRLVNSPCILLNPSEGPSVQMEKVMKMMNKDYAFSKRVFEINPDHDLIKKLVDVHKKDPASDYLKKISLQLLDNLILREGVMDNFDEMVERINDIMLKAADNIEKQ